MTGIPDVINERYRVIRLLGEGTSAQTLLCEELETGREVAIKVLRIEHLESWKHYELFEREARVLLSLRHHGVPELHEYFKVEDAEGSGRPRLFLVQEFVEGVSVYQRIKDGPRFSSMDFLQLTLSILEVLDYLHGCAPPVFHRDIKPSNIIIRPTGAAVLVDFGSVCEAWRPGEKGGSTIVGTHGYMPPEQYLGQVGATSDLYALGATLLHIASGRSPSEFSFETGRFELPDLPVEPRVLRLIRALLEPAPRDRPQSAKAARDLLAEDVQGAEPPPEVGSALAVVESGGGSALVKRVIQDIHAPRRVEMGEKGRDPEGTFKTVYQNLVPRHIKVIPLTVTPSRRATGGEIALYFLLLFSTLGIWPLVVLGIQHKARKDYRDIFIDGIATVGRVVSVSASGGTNSSTHTGMVTYDFDVDAHTYRGRMRLHPGIVFYFGVGDSVDVLYDERDPRRSCLVFE